MILTFLRSNLELGLILRVGMRRTSSKVGAGQFSSVQELVKITLLSDGFKFGWVVHIRGVLLDRI